jgi:hypothetical protein
MAFENFKQTFWSKHIERELERKTILAEFTNQKHQGEVKFGNQVKILGVGTPTIGSYTGASIGDPEKVEDSSVMMLIDQRPFFNIGVDDVDKMQSVPGYMEAVLDEGAKGLALKVDSYIAGLAVNAGKLSATTQINSAAAAKTAIDAGILALRENDVAIDADVVMELPPFVYQLLKDKYIELDTANSEMMKKGIVGFYDNVRVRVSNNLYNDGTDYYGMIRTKNAIAYAKQGEITEPYRPHDYFEDAVKSMVVFGAKVVRPKELYAIRAHK